ncbi:hypothetical protein PENTCL1PPCAC_28602, partial [Pristionchus entomophagus]
KNDLKDLRDAHVNYNKRQESSKAEVTRVQKEKEDVMRESAAKQEASAMKLFELAEEKNKQLFALANHSAYSQA